MATPTGLYMNIVSCSTVTEETSPVTVALTKLIDIELDGKSVQEVFYGDNVSYPVAIRNVMKTREITLVGGDLVKLLSIKEDVYVTITVVIGDMLNGGGAGSGALQIVAKHAKRGSSPISATNNKVANGRLKFACAGDTGDTDPIAVTVL